MIQQADGSLLSGSSLSKRSKIRQSDPAPESSPSKMPIKAVPHIGKEIEELDHIRLIALSTRKNPILPQK